MGPAVGAAAASRAVRAQSVARRGCSSAVQPAGGPAGAAARAATGRERGEAEHPPPQDTVTALPVQIITCSKVQSSESENSDLAAAAADLSDLNSVTQ